jgi:hypothetical protein
VSLIAIVRSLRKGPGLNSWSLFMREFLARCTLFCGVAMSFFPTSGTFAEERLIMPFACQASGGRVNLIPGPSQSYRIFGRPEHQVFTACSPNRPELCRDWMVHRFDLDCGGARVSWLSVVDALTKWGPHRASVSDGRLHMRMGSWWSGQPMGPCYTRLRFDYGPWASGRAGFGWPCARTLVNNQQSIVDMPAGFAPSLGVYARFVSMPETIAATTVQSGDVVRPESGPSSVADQIVPNVKGRAVVQPRLPSKIGQAEGQAEPTASISQEPVRHDIAKGSERTKTVRQAPVGPIGVDTISAGKLGFGLIAILLLSAIWFARARRAAPVDAVAARGRPAAPPGLTPDPSQPRSSAAWQALIDDEWLPSNRSEALVLLGASPETAEHTLKKIVKNLRQNWHPDLASREEERQVRGLKLKQINVAWDIICGKRASA